MRVFWEFILQVVVTAVVVYFLFTWWDALPAWNEQKEPSPTALANNFMVFVTFIVVVGTVAVTIGALSYTKQYSQKKEDMLSENLNEVVASFASKKELRDIFLTKIFENEAIREQIENGLNTFNSGTIERVQALETIADDLDGRITGKVQEEIINYERRQELEESDEGAVDSEIADDINNLPAERE